MAPDTSSLCPPEPHCFPANATLALKCGREISSTLQRGASRTQRHDPSDDRVTPRDPKACGAWRLTQRLDVHINRAVNLQRESHRVTYLCDWPSVYQTGANSEPQNWNVKHLLLATKLTEGLATFSNPHHRSGVLTEGKEFHEMAMACLRPVAQFHVFLSLYVNLEWLENHNHPASIITPL